MMNVSPFHAFCRVLIVFAAVAAPWGLLAQPQRTAAQSTEDAETFEPYDVYVDQEEVVARCGPGGDYYRTDPLRHGQRLEVYLETPDGWLGIRPPKNSFSWVPADAVAVDRSGKSGNVTEAGTLAWIGTHLGKARKYMWQVQLTKGEAVTVLGRSEREGPDGPQMWYRIEPPAGEFRWVHRDQVVDSPELLLRNKPAAGQSIASGIPTPIEDDNDFQPVDYADPENRKPQKGLLATAKSILLNGADQYSPTDASGQRSATQRTATERGPDRNDPALDQLRPMNDRGAIPLVENSPANNLSFAQSQSLAAQVAETAASPIFQPQATASSIQTAQHPQTAPQMPLQQMQPSAAQAQYAPLADNSAASVESAGNVPAIGSGIANTGYINQAQPQNVQPIQRASQPPLMSIASTPQVRTIGGQGDEASPVATQAGGPTGSDANWVRGNARPPRGSTDPTPPATPTAPATRPGQPLQIPLPPAASQSPIPVRNLTPNQPMGQTTTMLGTGPSPAGVAATAAPPVEIPAELAAKNVDELQLELSRRMGATAPAIEVEPIRQVASRITQNHASEIERQRAAMLVQRIEQYQSIARRRDGDQQRPASSSLQAAARSAGTVTIPPGQVVLSGIGGAGGTTPGNASRSGGTGTSGGTVEAAGYLVQVYSARPDSPPFALTDAAGKTTHYVSPTPGVNLRRYLNQHISIGGQSGYETGLDTPHIIATAAVRSPEFR